MYSSMVYPHFVYGVEAWGDGNKTKLKRFDLDLEHLDVYLCYPVDQTVQKIFINILLFF